MPAAKLTLAGEGVDDLFLDTLLSLRETLVLSNRHFLRVVGCTG